MISSRALAIRRRRAGNFWPLAARTAPHSIRLYRRLSPSITPQPVVWLPGSIPKMRMIEAVVSANGAQYTTLQNTVMDFSFILGVIFLPELLHELISEKLSRLFVTKPQPKAGA